MDVDLARPRSRTGWAHLRGVLRSPSQTFEADFGASFWGMAFLVACVSTFLAFLVEVRAGEPAATLARTPVWAGLSLLAQRGATGIARRICGGDPDVSRATASQAAIVMNLTAIPVVVIALLLPASMPTAAHAALVGALGVASLVVGFRLVGQLYGTAFYCSVGRGVAGEIAGVVTVLAVVLGALAGLGVLLDARTGGT